MRVLAQIALAVVVLVGSTGCSTLTSYVGNFVDSAGSFLGAAGSRSDAPERSQVHSPVRMGGPTQKVRTTAYSHQEADSQPYGRKNAAGTNLKYGQVRSAAADWSVYPVGTVFRIEGEPYVYEVDDYGSALVGTKTIDLYKPTMSAMRSWGVREVDIEILRWGSYQKSLAILEPRQDKATHVRKMANSIRAKS